MTSAARYKAILKEVAADLEVEADSELCQHVATLRLLREGIQARIIRGERVAVDDVLALDQALKAYLPERKAPQIRLQYVQGVVGLYRCQHCHKENRLEEGSYTPVARAAPAPAAEAAPTSHDNGPVGPPVADAAPPKVVPIATHRPNVSASAFHSQLVNGHEVAPLKSQQGSYLPAGDPHPYHRRDVAHPLPTHTNGKG